MATEIKINPDLRFAMVQFIDSEDGYEDSIENINNMLSQKYFDIEYVFDHQKHERKHILHFYIERNKVIEVKHGDYIIKIVNIETLQETYKILSEADFKLFFNIQ